jgi:hypothetical protein
VGDVETHPVTVDSYKIVDEGDETVLRLRYGIPASFPYLGVWRRAEGPELIHLFSASPPEVFQGWGWTRQ